MSSLDHLAGSNVEVQDDIVDLLSQTNYKEGFYTEIESEKLEKGINEAVVKAISAKKKRTRMDA